jgi:hypothetical protein
MGFRSMIRPGYAATAGGYDRLHDIPEIASDDRADFICYR